MRKTTITLMLTVLFGLGLSLQAQTVYYVDPDGDNSDGLSPETAFKTVKKAIDAVKTVDPVTIYLKENTDFPESGLNTGNEGGNQAMAVNITIIGKNTTLGAGGSAARILRTQAENLTLKGITFQNLNGYSSIGGGIYFAGTNLTIDSCVFKNNKSSSTDGGAAIGIAGSSVNAVIIRNSSFEGNSCTNVNLNVKGVVITYQAAAGNFLVENCTFRDNIVSGGSGTSCIGMYNSGTNVNATAIFRNNTFYNNTSAVASSAAGSVPNICINTGTTAYVVNNTFYFDRRDTSEENDAKNIYRRTSAVGANKGNLHFINNVVSGMRHAIFSNATTGRTIIAKNNYAVVMENHPSVSELPRTVDEEENPIADANGNILVCALSTPSVATGTYVTTEDVAALDALLPVEGLATTLNEEIFPANLPLVEPEEGDSNPLIDAGLDTYIVSEVEYIPETDALGTARGDGETSGSLPDIGAFEYAVEEEDPDPNPTGLSNVTSGALSIVARDGLVRIVSGNEKALKQVLVYSLQGTLLVDRTPDASLVELALPEGLYIVRAITESDAQTAKILIK